MNGYSKMKTIGTTKSRSMDFSDLLTKFQEPNNQIKKPARGDSFAEQDEDHQEWNSGGGVDKLGRSSSVSSASAVQSALKRVLSVRSSSFTERYCRIHDQSVTTIDDDDEEEDGVEMGRTASVKKKKHSKSKILKACKKLFGL